MQKKETDRMTLGQKVEGRTNRMMGDRKFRYLCLACAVVIWGDGCRQGGPPMYGSYEAFD
jgi:hypothetical protein